MLENCQYLCIVTINKKRKTMNEKNVTFKMVKTDRGTIYVLQDEGAVAINYLRRNELEDEIYVYIKHGYTVTII